MSAARQTAHPLAHVEEQPLDVRGLAPQQRDALVVSFIQVGKQLLILSRYGDDRWELIPDTTNGTRSSRVVDFTRVPAAFRDVMKAIMYRYLRRGRARQKRPRAATLRNFFGDAASFLRYVASLNVQHLADVTPMVCKLYVDACTKARGPKKKPLTAGTLLCRFLAVEAIHELSQFTDDPMPAVPWPETSAKVMVGLTGEGDPRNVRGGTTPVIPDDLFAALFQAAWKTVEQGHHWLDLRDGVLAIDANLRGRSIQCIKNAKNRHLETSHWIGGLRTFNRCLLDLRTACYVVVASLSGCRNHELAFIQTDACYRTEDDDGEIYYWMKSRSTKTGAGDTEWMIPDAAVTALRTMDRWAEPYQAMIEQEITRRHSADPHDPEIARAEVHRRAVFLGKTLRNDNQVRTLSVVSWNVALKAFAAQHCIAWNLRSHQFRRTFANYAARSQFGDLRYLKEHFKHWSMDMTLSYALNESQEMALFIEIADELDELKEGVVSQWLDPVEPLAGGYGRGIVDWRGSNAITIFKDRSSMVRSISQSTAIRSNGHAWCTADDNLCVGNGGLEATRCTGCENAVIGRKHVGFYQGLHDHLKELLDCRDIGEGGLARVRRDLGRCRDVLTLLDHTPEAGAA